MKTQLYRHGEIVFEKIDNLPPDLEEKKTNTFAEGKTGNSHTFKGGKLYLKNEDEFIYGYFKAQNTKLFHSEHGEKKEGILLSVELPNGFYRLRKQNEFINGELRVVVD